jgi:hypothetical protein
VQKPNLLAWLLVLATAALGCGESVELTIGVAVGADNTLMVSNADEVEWIGANLVVETVESDNSTAPCVDRVITVWKPGEAIAIPSCGNKIRLTLTTGGETARFAWANGQLYRRFGRKEVPIAKP